MVVARATANRVGIYTLPDLSHWTHHSDFGPLGARGRSWESPDLFELPVRNGRRGEIRWVLGVTVGSDATARGSGVQ